MYLVSSASPFERRGTRSPPASSPVCDCDAPPPKSLLKNDMILRVTQYCTRKGSSGQRHGSTHPREGPPAKLHYCGFRSCGLLSAITSSESISESMLTNDSSNPNQQQRTSLSSHRLHGSHNASSRQSCGFRSASRQSLGRHPEEPYDVA